MFGRKERRTIPYGMFDHASYGLAAKNARVLERVYHKAHAQAWDGKEVLAALVELHGTPTLEPHVKEALGRVFSIILWGELAAWRISAELADEIEPIEGKLAATSQAFDEARHFYVMHDYLELLGVQPNAIHWGARRLLERVMNADNLAKKLLGMQLMVEPIALTLFHVVKSMNLEPVLSALLPYYERDESRHVALGIQYLPAMMARMSRAERLELFAFQGELLTYEVVTNTLLMRDLQQLGVHPRTLIDVGKTKQLKAMEMVLGTLDLKIEWPLVFLDHYAEALVELTIPAPEMGVVERLTRVARAARYGTVGETPDVALVPDIADRDTPLVHSVRGQRRESLAEAA